MRIRTPVTWAALALAACGEPPTSVEVQPEFAVGAAAAPVPFHEVDLSGFADRNPFRHSAVTGSTNDGALLVSYQAVGDTSRQVLRKADGSFETLLDPDGSPRIFSAKIDAHGDLAGSYGNPFAASAFARIHGVDAIISVPDASILTVAGLGGDSLVAGSYRDDWTGETRAFVWSTNTDASPLPILGTPPAVGAVYSYVGAVNDRGMVLGWQLRSEFSGGSFSSEYRVWLWSRPLGLRDLGDWSAPLGVFLGGLNRSGQIVGTRRLPGGCADAILTAEGAPLQVLPNPFDGCNTTAVSINDAGTVVGTAREPGFGANHGVVWFSDGTTLELAVPAGATGVFVSFIDNAGVIGGGYYAGGQYHPGYWTLTLDPQTKDDCKDGGWEGYGFKNQGQCVRFIETGQDSR